MVDVHSHILPNIDDGATSIAESIGIIESALLGGVTDIICTPHYSPELQDFESIINLRNHTFELLNRAITDQHILMKLHKGMEVSFSPALIPMIDSFRSSNELHKVRSLCLAESQYMLLEFSQLTFPIWATSAIYELQLRGITPVIAHIERNSWVLREKNEMLSWAEKGVVFQMNASCLDYSMKDGSKKTVEFLLNNPFKIVVGSDAHDLMRRGMDSMNRVFLASNTNQFGKKSVKHEMWIENGFNILRNHDII
ncbi:MAG: CpsB/CapC family capsule biosynthesis tyrosine phosphatase [Clostridia bacterium]